MRSLLPLLFLASASLARADAEAIQFEHYYGEVKLSSPDGTVPFGKTASLVARSVSSERRTILEKVIQPNRVAGEPATESTVELVRVRDTLTFDAADTARTFTGTVTFLPAETDWKWKNWTYQITLTAGGTIAGEGRFDERGAIVTRRLLSSPDGGGLLIQEELLPISPMEYEELRRRIVERPGS